MNTQANNQAEPVDTGIFTSADGGVRVVAEGRMDEPLMDSLTQLAGYLLRVNQLRIDAHKAPLLLTKLALELAPVELNDEERDLLTKATITKFADEAPFASPSEVRQYFTPATLTLVDAGVELPEDELKAMAEVVIKARANCLF